MFVGAWLGLIEEAHSILTDLGARREYDTRLQSIELFQVCTSANCKGYLPVKNKFWFLEAITRIGEHH